ncbi:hypothetical protein AX16_010165 [Volvariella volvacea WC 439]|nr:hypothetical protein AX16_010165 [Volvariella volvacea WC 439]
MTRSSPQAEGRGDDDKTNASSSSPSLSVPLSLTNSGAARSNPSSQQRDGDSTDGRVAFSESISDSASVPANNTPGQEEISIRIESDSTIASPSTSTSASATATTTDAHEESPKDVTPTATTPSTPGSSSVSESKIPSFRVHRDLTLAATVLRNMQAKAQAGLEAHHARGDLAEGPPAVFGAGGPMLKQFDESTVTSKRVSQAPTPPSAVRGIGGKVAKPDYSDSKIVLAMVGLPARGKSYLSNKLMIYLKWLEYDVKVFNVGQLRRTRAKERAQQSGVQEDHTASFFSHNNPHGTEEREKLALDSLEMLIDWLKKGGNVGIHDATNSTKARRAWIQARVAKEKGISLIFLESLCDDPAVIAANVALKVQSGDPDYKHIPPEEARRDFLRRISEYEKVYETITEPHLSYMRITNVGSKVTLSRINGYLSSRIAFYLMNLHLKPRSIYLSRHGESQFNVEGKIGGDSLLSSRGMQYADAIPGLVKKTVGDTPLTVWTSTLRRTIQTAAKLPYPKLTWKSLDELDAGVCDGMTYEVRVPSLGFNVATGLNLDFHNLSL